MVQILGFFVLVAVAVFAIKLAFLFLILAGLIFRTRETIGVLMLCGALALISKYPFIGWSLVAVIAITAILRLQREDTQKQSVDTAIAEDEPPASA